MNNPTDKKIEIIEVAEKLFADKGFDGTSVRDIAAAANINIAMISYYFGSKEKLLQAIVIHRIEAMSLQLANLYQENISPVEKMNKLIALYIQRIFLNQSFYQIVHIELGLKKMHLDLEEFKKVKKNNLALIKNIISQGQEEGLFQNDVNIELIQPLIIGPLINVLMNKSMYYDILKFTIEEEFEYYILTTFTKHIQKTIIALLKCEDAN